MTLFLYSDSPAQAVPANHLGNHLLTKITCREIEGKTNRGVHVKLCVLGSGSTGNCIFVDSGRTRLLIDAGLSAKSAELGLKTIGVTPGDIHGVCLTHEHEDHTRGLCMLSRRHGIPAYANEGTIDALDARGKAPGASWNEFASDQPFALGDIQVEPFPVPHDACDPVGFVLCAAGLSGAVVRVGIVTDLGMATELVRQRLKECHALVLEANHDDTLLRNSRRPWSLKQRIAGRQGHFSNAQALALLNDIAHPALHTVFLAHMSSQCNHPDQARTFIRKGLAGNGHSRTDIQLTWPRRISRIWESQPAAAVLQ